MSITWNCEKCGKPQKALVVPNQELVHEDIPYAKTSLCQGCYNKIMVEKQAQVEAIVEEGKTQLEAVAIVKEGRPLAEAVAIVKEGKTLAETIAILKEGKPQEVTETKVVTKK